MCITKGYRVFIFSVALSLAATPSLSLASQQSRCAELINTHLVATGPMAQQLATHALNYSSERQRLEVKNAEDPEALAEQFNLEIKRAQLERAQEYNAQGMLEGFQNTNGIMAHYADHYYTNAAQDLARVEREIESYTLNRPSAPLYEARARTQNQHLYSPLTGDFVLEKLPRLGDAEESFLAFRDGETKVETLTENNGYRVTLQTSAVDSPLKDLIEAAALWKLGSLGGNKNFEPVQKFRSSLILQATNPNLASLEANIPYTADCEFGQTKDGTMSLVITIYSVTP
jgi:hypothetical protein